MNLLIKIILNCNFSIIRSQKGIAPLVIIVAVAIMAAAVPTTVILVQQEQDNRQEAQTATQCGSDRCSPAEECTPDRGCKIKNDWSCAGQDDDDCSSQICIEGYCKANTNPPGEECGEDTDCTFQETGHTDTPSARNCRRNKCVSYKLPQYSECYTDLQCLSRSCRTDQTRGYKSGKSCQGRDPSPTNTPVPTNTPTPRATNTPTPTLGVINTTPGLTPIQARGSLGITINSNGVEYTRVTSILHVFGGIVLEEYDDTKRSSNAHRWDIPNRTWSNINQYQFVTNIYQGERIIKTERHEPFKVSSSPIIRDYTIELDPNEIENPESTNTPTPEDKQGEEERIQDPTATPRPIDWCREDGDQGQGQGCCSDSSCQPNLKCTGNPTPGGLRCCPANTFWNGTECAGASCQSLSFSCVPNSTKPGEQCCSPQFACNPVSQRCIVNTAPTPTDVPNSTPTPTPTRPVITPPATPDPNVACSAFGGQNGCTAWCRGAGGGGPNSYCNETCGADGTGCIVPVTGTPIPTVTNNCAVFGGHASCDNWCRSTSIGANGCNTDCNGCY